LIEEQEKSLEKTLKELLNVFTEFKITILFIPFLISLFAVFMSLSIPNQYTSETLLFPVENDSPSDGLLGGALDLSAIAGIDLASLSGKRNISQEGMEIIKSRKFLTNFIKKEELLIPLMASNGWDQEQDNLKINNKIYDLSLSKWTRKINGIIKPPSDQEAFKRIDKIINISKDRQTGFITLKVKFYSPNIAKEWSEKIVSYLNESMKLNDVLEAKKMIDFLDKEFSRSRYTEMRRNLASLKESQIKKVMLAEARNEYVFRTIDPPIAPEIKSEPVRSSIVLGAGFFSFFLANMIAFFLKKLGYRERLHSRFPFFYKLKI
jgi:capsular polysaccharide biosynthesis protein